MYVMAKFNLVMVCRNSSIERLPRVYTRKRRAVHPNLSNLITKCTNPLYYDTEACVALWDSMDAFNREVDNLRHNVDRLGHGGEGTVADMYNDNKCDDPDYAHTEECRVYDS